MRFRYAAVTLAVVAGACSGGDGSVGSAAVSATVPTATSAAPAASTAPPAASTASPAPVPTVATAPLRSGTPLTLAELDQLAATERAAVVARIRSNGWGRANGGGTVTGPAGFAIDLANCPDEWSDTGGLSDTDITIGQIVAQTGTLADFGNAAVAARAVFDEVNRAGGITDSVGRTRRINLVVADDGYDPARTAPLVDRFIADRSAFALVSTGWQQALPTRNQAGAACVPGPLSTFHPGLGDPMAHPWIATLSLPLTTEGALWVALIDKEFAALAAGDGQVDVHVVVGDDLFGRAQLEGFQRALAASPNAAGVEVTVEFNLGPGNSAGSLEPDRTGVDVVIATGARCDHVVGRAAETALGRTASRPLVSSLCRETSLLVRRGPEFEGWLSFDAGTRDLARWRGAQRVRAVGQRRADHQRGRPELVAIVRQRVSRRLDDGAGAADRCGPRRGADPIEPDRGVAIDGSDPPDAGRWRAPEDGRRRRPLPDRGRTTGPVRRRLANVAEHRRGPRRLGNDPRLPLEPAVTAG